MSCADVGELWHRARECRKRPPQSHAQAQRRRNGQRMAALFRPTLSRFRKFFSFFLQLLFFPTNSQQRPVYFSNNYVVSRYTTRRALDNTPTSSSWPFPTLASVWSNASRAARLNRCTCCSHLGKSNFTFYSKFSPDFGRRLTV